MKLVKKQTLEPGQSAATAGGLLGRTVDRRTFLRGTGLAAGGAAVATTLSMRMMKRADAASAEAGDGEVVTKRSVCTHCSVGCGVIAEVQNGVWTGQEPDFDSPFNLGAHCAKGAAVREHGHGDKRLKYPMKLVGGKWERISWDQAIEEIGDKVLADPRAVQPRLRLLARLGEVLERAVIPVPQVRGTVGHATTSTTRHASATRRRWRVSRTPGATAR